MASKAQRVGIWIIAGALTVGTIGSFAIMILQNDNQKRDAEVAQQLQGDNAAQQKAAQEAYLLTLEPLTGYDAEAFDASTVTALQKDILVSGTGDEVKETDSINASYFGWSSDGKIFDSSKKIGADDEPVTFPLSGVIAGWTQGLTGQRVGSTIKLTIPADLAYGASGTGSIAPNSPLVFIVTINTIEQ